MRKPKLVRTPDYDVIALVGNRGWRKENFAAANDGQAEASRPHNQRSIKRAPSYDERSSPAMDRQ